MAHFKRRSASSRGTGRLSPRAIAVTQKRAQAMSFRLQGRTFEQIGRALGVTPGRAHQLVDEAMAATLQEPAERLRGLQLARLETAMRGIFGKVMKGDTKAIGPFLKIMDRQAKLLGLYELPKEVRGGACPVDHHVSVTFVEARPTVR